MQNETTNNRKQTSWCTEKISNAKEPERTKKESKRNNEWSKIEKLERFWTNESLENSANGNQKLFYEVLKEHNDVRLTDQITGALFSHCFMQEKSDNSFGGLRDVVSNSTQSWYRRQAPFRAGNRRDDKYESTIAE
ncbi:hypothetical protein FQR65_LT19083 [Abscondita terminalis]|nr:hypothetical protein FQR65_LT11930 [Abscondita terminalis]KAF5302661.1 hypothetical protein FQR65_LT19083 [Abscondita terminalis]